VFNFFLNKIPCSIVIRILYGKPASNYEARGMTALADRLKNNWRNYAVIEFSTKETAHAEPDGDTWKVNDWVKKAVILYFPIRKMETIE